MDKRIKRIHVNDNAQFILLGRTGENEFRTIEIDISGWVDDDAEYRIIYSRPDGVTYPVPATRKGDILSWTPTAYDLEIPCFGIFEVRAYIGNIIGKSTIFTVEISESLETDETQPGTVRPDWIDDILDKVVISKIEQTETSFEDGGINIFTITLTNGDERTFEVRNGNRGSKGDKGEKGDTGEKGDIGPQGIQGEKGTRGERGPQGIQGEKGEEGKTGPRGIQGERGEKGDSGAPGEKGEPGANGADGKDGYTPQRGVDYWTETDKSEIKSYVDEAILGGAW